MKNNISIVAVSGSLRENSSATNVLMEVAKLFPGFAEVIVYNGVGKLPHFNDSDVVPFEVEEWRQLIKKADGVIICQPEYAFGVAGSLKNALDWLVGSGSLDNKPLALITAATGGDKAHNAMLLTLTALNANVAEAANMVIPFVRAKLNNKGELADTEVIQSLKIVTQALLKTIDENIAAASG
ncbi:MAG: NAD(P)H-dependent oxidoreductase [Ginsengibacter sp.]